MKKSFEVRENSTYSYSDKVFQANFGGFMKHSMLKKCITKEKNKELLLLESQTFNRKSFRALMFISNAFKTGTLALKYNDSRINEMC